MAAMEIARLESIAKSFGAVKALVGVNLSVESGSCLGLVGYNGAGKSTLMHILAGTLRPDSGSIFIRAEHQTDKYSVAQAQRLGIRCVFQELSLCPNLSVVENTRVFHRSLSGRGWRRKAAGLISEVLDEIFPDHGISPEDIVGDLPIGKRQMVEIARAFTVTDDPLCMVILDEPTSSLDVSVSEQLLKFIRTSAEGGLSIIMISHILNEVLECSEKIAVMRDGRVVAVRQVSDLDRDKLVALMGDVSRDESAQKPLSHTGRRQGDVVVRAHVPSGSGVDEVEFVAHRGEIVGLAGLAGHGQTEMLLKLFKAEGKTHGDTTVNARVSFVAGDRQSDGIFPLWSIIKNISICSYRRFVSKLLIDLDQEKEMGRKWQQLINIKTPDLRNNILSLSGGNQQKALFARALGSAAQVVLMDDPMRGVDVNTKREVYELIQDEAAKGRCFIWYTTEIAELGYCDRVYVFRNKFIVSQLAREEITEDRVIQSAFIGLPVDASTHDSARLMTNHE